ncbi:hypothetical protein [Psychrobacter jeotgali]|uniref:hypothetical protein n=1 Tax=Psychrobacter jeotgali TaxID=179010 RepID=UPI001918BC9B|nr:hypothetical protein [Psychrobacter jeotgali]
MNNIGDKLISDLTIDDIMDDLIKKLNNFFFVSKDEVKAMLQVKEVVFQRLENCIKNIDNKYFIKDGNPYFSYIHSGQYLIFLYIFSNEISKMNLISLKEKLYYLNKILHSVDIYPDVELPECFFLEHPMGTVLGRAEYGNNFMAMQGCTIGGDKGVYPVLGSNLKMYSNSKILGNCNIGSNVSIGADASIKNQDIQDNCLVFGQSPNLIIKPVHNKK